MAERGSRHRFELSRLELVGVAISTAAGFFVVFLLGIYAGRGMVERRLEEEQQVVRLPVPAATEDAAPRRAPTFDERLAGGAGDLAEESLALEGARAEPPPAPRPSPTGAGERAAGPPVVPDRAPAFPPPAVAVAPPPARAPRADAAPPSPARTPEARVAAAVAKPTEPPPPAKGSWSIQVTATRDPRHAQRVSQSLIARGYAARVQQVRRSGETFFRVRVGSYATLDQAQKVAARLRREPGVPEAFVASD